MKNEMLRKFIVSLKRKPQNIAMAALVVSFLVYSLNLTSISNTTAKIQGSGMGFTGFCTMLFSMLSFVCFLNAFPYRKKVNVPMLVLMFAMFAIVAGCDWFYLGAITRAVTRAESPISPVDFPYVAKAQWVLYAHLILLGVTMVLIATMPVYKKALRKIKTSVEVEDNGKLEAIDISEE